MSGDRRSWRLVPAAASGWLTAAMATTMPSTAALGAGVGAALVVVAVVAVVVVPERRPRVRSVVLLATVAVAVAAATAASVALAGPGREAAVEAGLAAGRSVVVDAVVTGKPERRVGGAMDAVARTATVASGARVSTVDAPVRIHVDDRALWPAEADVGARVRVTATVRGVETADREVAELRAGKVEVRSPPTGPAALASGLRASLRTSVQGLPAPGASLVPGLAVGDTSAVDDELDAAMKTSSLAHLTAVSGANCAVVVGAAFGLAALCGARRAIRVVVALSSLAGFVLLVTPEPSVVRAAVMAGIAMLALLLGRRAAGVALLCVTVAGCLIADPWLATSLGFALSTAATAALLLVAPILAVPLGRVLPGPLALGISVPLAAELACAPLLVLIDPTIGVWGVVANLLADPAAPAATVAGLLACLAAPVPFLQSGIAALAWVPAAWIAGVAATVATLPSPRLPWIGGAPGAVALAVVGGGVLLLASGRGPRILRRAVATALALGVGVWAGFGVLSGVAAPWTAPRDAAIVACDVGQGDAVVLRSGGRVALVDTGPEPGPVRACLQALGVDRIDLLVLTHFDLDHVGGVAALVGRVGTAIHGPVPDPPAQRSLDDLARGGAEVVPVVAGARGILGAATWRALWPAPGTELGNDASVVLDVRGPDLPPTLLLGDLGAEAQVRVRASAGFVPPYAVVKVAHHGSADQDAGLYRAARPTLALVTVGAENRYGHPRAQALAILAEVGAVVRRTDEDGMVGVEVTSSGLAVSRSRAP